MNLRAIEHNSKVKDIKEPTGWVKGSRVECIKDHYSVKKGMHGKVERIHGNTIRISWDDNVSGHDNSGGNDNGAPMCEMGHGWCVPKDRLKVISE
jgi:hypothetical protein